MPHCGDHLEKGSTSRCGSFIMASSGKAYFCGHCDQYLSKTLFLSIKSSFITEKNKTWRKELAFYEYANHRGIEESEPTGVREFTFTFSSNSDS